MIKKSFLVTCISQGFFDDDDHLFEGYVIG